MKLYICYEDKGISGISGMDTTPRKKLIIVEGTYDQIKQKIEELESSFPKNGRISPKLTNYYMEGNEKEKDEYGFGDEIVYL
jgi:hypothetical protein